MPATVRSAYGFLTDIGFSKLNVRLTKNRVVVVVGGGAQVLG